jgi:sarcosine oxidase, subunit beta
VSAQPDIVVVGAGAFGLSAAHHLAERGMRVLVLERDRVAGATSTCGAGFIGLWGCGMVPELGKNELKAERYGTRFYTELHRERPQFSFREAGMLFIALDEPGWDRYIQPIAECDVDGQEVLDAQGTADRGQILDVDHVYGGVFHPGTVQVVARDAIRALGDRLRSHGVEIREHTPVSSLSVHDGRIVGVRTEREEINCSRVVLATAMWTNSLLAGHATPLAYAPMGALRITTVPIGLPPTMPMLMVTQVGAWLREEGGALRWGCLYQGAHRDALLDLEPPEKLEELPMDGLRETETVGRRLSAAIPALASYDDFSYVQGYPCYTPDKASLFGPVPEVDGLWAITGDTENGITHGPGYGRALAQTIVGEPPELDIDRYRLDRFSDSMPSPTPRQVAERLFSKQRIFANA